MSFCAVNSPSLLFKWAIVGFVLATSLIAVMPSAHAATPQQLYGKSIVMNWIETRDQRDQADNGMWSEWKNFNATLKLSVYIASTGRLFMRQVGTTPLGSVTTDQVTGKGLVPSFSGRTMTIIEPGSGGVRRMDVQFDAGYSSCTARIVTAYEAGKTRIYVSPLTKHTLEVRAAPAGSITCAMQAGNALQ